MKAILQSLYQMLPFVLVSIPVFCLVRWVMGRCTNIPSNWKHEVTFLLFVMFLSGLASITAIPELEWNVNGLRIANAGGGGINLIPFVVFYDIWMEYFERNNIGYFLINFLGNIVMFLPIGFCFPLLWERMSMKKVVLIGFGCSLLIEICQLPVARGTDIDDLWLNTIGTAIGWGIYRFTSFHWPGFVEQFKLKNKSQ
jgi:glycopeptide antibiotics resistance protein